MIDFDDADAVFGSRGLRGVAAPVETDLIVGLVAKPELVYVGGVVDAKCEDVFAARVIRVNIWVREFVNYLFPITIVDVTIAHIDVSVVVGILV